LKPPGRPKVGDAAVALGREMVDGDGGAARLSSTTQ